MTDRRKSPIFIFILKSPTKWICERISQNEATNTQKGLLLLELKISKRHLDKITTKWSVCIIDYRFLFFISDVTNSNRLGYKLIFLLWCQMINPRYKLEREKLLLRWSCNLATRKTILALHLPVLFFISFRIFCVTLHRLTLTNQPILHM